MRFFELCASRYGAPFLIIGDFIEIGRLSDFVKEVWQAYSEDRLYQIWLYKVEDGTSFGEFKASVISSTSGEEIDITKTLDDSRKILNSVIPN